MSAQTLILLTKKTLDGTEILTYAMFNNFFPLINRPTRLTNNCLTKSFGAYFTKKQIAQNIYSKK